MISIAGAPSEMQLIAHLVHELLQVSKDQEKSYIDQKRYMFLFEWLFNQGTKDDHDLEEKGCTLGIAVQGPWVVCTTSLFDQPDITTSSLKASRATRNAFWTSMGITSSSAASETVCICC